MLEGTSSVGRQMSRGPLKRSHTLRRHTRLYDVHSLSQDTISLSTYTAHVSWRCADDKSTCVHAARRQAHHISLVHVYLQLYRQAWACGAAWAVSSEMPCRRVSQLSLAVASHPDPSRSRYRGLNDSSDFLNTAQGAAGPRSHPRPRNYLVGVKKKQTSLAGCCNEVWQAPGRRGGALLA